MTNPTVSIRKPKFHMEVDGSIKVANGDVFLPYLTLVAIPDEQLHYVILHKKNCIPRGKDFIGKFKVLEDNYECYKIASVLYLALRDSIYDWNNQEYKSQLSPFTWLYTHMKLTYGYDLFEYGIFKL